LREYNENMENGKLIETIISIKEDLSFVKENMATKADLSDLQASMDAYAKKADGYFQEMIMLAHKFDRHERWLLQIAEKVGVKLEY